MKCIACDKESGSELKALQLWTMHVRGLTGEDKYQVPDDSVTSYCVCEDCAKQWLSELGWKGKRTRKKLLTFLLVLIVGAAAAMFFRQIDQVLFLTGLSAVLCGAVGLIATYRKAAAEKKRFQALPSREAMEEAAYQVLIRHAPAKMQTSKGDWNVTYVPVTEKTLKTKPGDLMVMYDIQPSVAKEVMLKIGHPDA